MVDAEIVKPEPGEVCKTFPAEAFAKGIESKIRRGLLVKFAGVPLPKPGEPATTRRVGRTLCVMVGKPAGSSHQEKKEES